MAKQSQTQKRIDAANLVAGIQKHCARNQTYWISGKSYSYEEYVAFFQAQVDALDAITSARSALMGAVAKERAVAKKVGKELPLLRTVLAHQFGAAVLLADFGIKPRKKPGPKTVAAKVAGVLKARATREARGTRGRARP
jgi:hypothetical protein